MSQTELPMNPGSRQGTAAPAAPVQMVDPAVSRAKFEWELAQFRQWEAVHRQRGILIVRARFPEVLLAFASPDRPGSPVVAGALIDYTDYDHSAPSVRLIDPFSERPYAPADLPPALLRRVVTLTDTGGRPVLVRLVSAGADGPVALCLPGTLLYYGHPGAAGHAWAAARVRDAGALSEVADHVRSHLLETGAGRQPVTREAAPVPNTTRPPA